MFQYKYSDLVAGVVSFGDVSGGHSSRYLGIPAVNLSANTGFSSDF